MKHLLLNRFQGALIGANTIYLNSQQIAPNQLLIAATPAIASGLNSLLVQGQFDLQDWTQNTFSERIDPQQAIVSMLPLMLFFHDDRSKLREVLINISHGWQLDWETCSCGVAIGYIISRSLTESFNSRTIVSQLLDEAINLHPLVFQELSAIERSMVGATSLQQTIQRVDTIPHPIIAATILAIYCFLSSPNDFLVAIRRAVSPEARLRQREASRREGDRRSRVQLTCALTGIMAGAHGSLTGIPLNGYIATQNREQWLLAAEKLLAVWAGVYQESSESQIPPMLAAGAQPIVVPSLAVASPQVIQAHDR